MADGQRFTVAEFTKLAQGVAQELANNSQDGTFSLSEATSALSRFNNHEESRKSREILGRDIFGFKVAKRAG